jgi:truncated hemoglobin YjbI
LGLALAGVLATAWACSGDGPGPVGGGDAEVQEFAAVAGSEIATSGYLGDLTEEQREGVRAAFERAHASLADIRSRFRAGAIDREQAGSEARAVHDLLLEELGQFLTPDQIRELRDRRPHRPWHADFRLTPEQAREIRGIWNALHDALQQIARKLHAGEIGRDEARLQARHATSRAHAAICDVLTEVQAAKVAFCS